MLYVYKGTQGIMFTKRRKALRLYRIPQFLYIQFGYILFAGLIESFWGLLCEKRINFDIHPFLFDVVFVKNINI